MMYGSWDIKHDGQNFLSFWTFFALTYKSYLIQCESWFPWRYNNPKNQNFEKLRNSPGGIIILHKYTKNHDPMLYCSLDMVSNGFNCYFSFWAIFCPFIPLTAKKIKIFQKWKKHLEISSFYIRVPKIMIRRCTVPEIWCATNGRTDRRTEKVTYRGGCPT